MAKELDLFDRFWKGFPEKGGATEYASIMDGRCDLEEFDDRYEIELEVPGVKKNEVSVDVLGDRLTVRWSRQREKKRGIGKSARLERSSGSFVRNFCLEGADSSSVKAELKNGVLKIDVTKRPDSRPKTIEIK